MIRTLIALALAEVLALPMATSAADDMASAKSAGTGVSRDGRFEELDKNHDGFVSRDEGKDAEELNTRFSELDVNNDNKLSREEYNALNKGSRSASGATASKTRK